jgi:hypothetical protein
MNEQQKRVLQISNRAHALLSSGLFPKRHPAANTLRLIDETAVTLSERSHWGDTDVNGALSTRVIALAQTADQEIADSLSTNGAVAEFASYFGNRSLAGPLDSAPLPCPCGMPAFVFHRSGRLAKIPDSTQVICDRCGDIENSTIGAPTVRLSSPTSVSPGSTITPSVRVSGVSGHIIVGLALRNSLRAEVLPPTRSIYASSTAAKATSFQLDVSPITRRQAEYLIPFAVSELRFSVGRFHIKVH